VLPKLPHVVCLTEHQLKEEEIENLSMNQYILGATFWRQNLKHGSTGIFVHESLAFTSIVQEFCMWQDTEVCVVKINLLTAMIYVICVYRTPTGNFICFIQGADIFLNKLITKYWNYFMRQYKYRLSWWKLLHTTTTGHFICYIQLN